MSSDELVTFEERDRVAIISLNRPDRRNAIDIPTSVALRACFDRFESSKHLAVAILRGEGTVFCAGLDLSAVASGEAADIVFRDGGFGGFVSRHRKKPVIAAVQGAALAGGFELVLACDLVIATDDCRFGLPEVMRGLVAGGGGILRLAAQLPRPVVNEILLTGDAFLSARAAHLGLVNRIVPKEHLLEAALEIASKIAANAPLSVELSLSLADAVTGFNQREAWALSDAALRATMESQDAREGARAFKEKRSPRWTGQ